MNSEMQNKLAGEIFGPPPKNEWDTVTLIASVPAHHLYHGIMF